VPGPWWYPYYPYDYYYGPYYDPYYPYYAAPYPVYYPATPSAEGSAVPPSVRYDVKALDDQIAKRRAYLDYQLDDGDITRTQRDAEVRRLSQISQEAHADADANAGQLTRDQFNRWMQEIWGATPAKNPPSASVEPWTAPPSGAAREQPARRDLTAVNDLLLELRALLDQKLKDGTITPAQHDAERQYLDKLQEQAKAQAASNGGTLTADQEEALVRQLHKAYYSISHNFIGG
jgi:uncharacterized protein YjiS (DUF1127 family)